MAKSTAELRPRFRVLQEGEIALGPGKVELLRKVQQSGSIAQAAKEMDMSYMRAWKLLKTMEHCFCEPLIIVSRGGSKHGGAVLSKTGEAVLQLYTEMQENSLKAAAGPWKKLQKLLKE